MAVSSARWLLRLTHGPACLHHYLHLGGRQWDIYIEGKERVNLKKYFYILRPAMAVRWIRLYPEAIPPMNFQELLAEINLPSDLVSELNNLLIQKSRSKEVGEAPRISTIDDFITSEFTWAREAVNEYHAGPHDMKDEADALFRTIVKEQGPRIRADGRCGEWSARLGGTLRPGPGGHLCRSG